MTTFGKESKRLEETIKAEAYRLGFSLCGITTSEPLEQFGRYQFWLNNGFNANMAYLATNYHFESRKDPRKLMSSAQSVICLAYPYSLHSKQTLSAKDTHLIAGYAVGIDYHHAIPEMLASLVSTIENLCSRQFEFKIFSDSAPILERELACRAGLGWIGRNTCLINPSRGSAFLLAEIFLDLPLSPDKPFDADRCGSCNRCVESCPTRAILPDRTIDSNRCLSYHTIESKNDIPNEIAEKLPPWLFGCDICQMVCPWNRQSALNDTAISFSGSELIGLLHLTPDEFSDHYAHSSIRRAKYFGFMRNLLINVASFDNNTSLPVLEEFININSDERLRNLALFLLEKIKKRTSTLMEVLDD